MTSYSPVFDVQHDNPPNDRPEERESRQTTYTVHSDFASCALLQINGRIRSAIEADKVVHAFSRKVESDWHLKVVKPTQRRVNLPPSIDSPSFLFSLQEPYMPETQTIMCNTGWTTDNDYNEVPQQLLLALPHFSFKWSNRQFMIGSLQASIDHRHKLITIIAPTLMSREGNKYGCEDLGMKGICNYFCWNPRNRYVPNFEVPRYPEFIHEPTPRNLVYRDVELI